MALFDKLFTTKRKLDDVGRSSKITPQQLRLLLFKECDWRGRKILFDSSTIEKVPAGKNDQPCGNQANETPYIVEVSNGFSYLYKGPATDACALGEMIFGAVAINLKGVSLKIHIMDEPKRLMCTKLFTMPHCRKQPHPEKRDREQPTTPGSTPLNVPQGKEEVALSFSFDRGDSGFYGEHSLHSSVSSTCEFFSMYDGRDGNMSQDDIYTFHSPPGRKISNSSNGSWQRRTFRNLSTKFDLSSSGNLLTVPTATSTGTSSDSQGYSNSSISGTSDSLASGTTNTAQRRSKLGLALLITVSEADEKDLIRKCVEHSPQLQALVCRLRLVTLAAGGDRGFVGTLHRATVVAATWLSDLMYGPRLQPMWLNLVSEERGRNKLAETLLSDICSVLSVADTKHTNFFISTLLTHVLTHHLGWVTTVSPYDVVEQNNNTTAPNNNSPRSYNALWAQLSDLCGSIGVPPRAAKTIISGANNQSFLNRLLLVLTYFVRCGEVHRRDYKFQDSEPVLSQVINVVPETQKKSVKTGVVTPEIQKKSVKTGFVTPEIQKKSVKSGFVTPEIQKKKTVNMGLKRTATQKDLVSVKDKLPMKRDSECDKVSERSMKKTATLANLFDTLSTEFNDFSEPMTSQIKRNPTIATSLKSNSNSSIDSSEPDLENNVVFVLGDDEKLVGLKNKSNGGKSVKKSTKISVEAQEGKKEVTKENCDRDKCSRNSESPSKCCGQTLQHSMTIKHSGFKFEFDKYPQIVTNYMKSKNLEILDKHYIGKPGNLKLDNFSFDPTVVPPIQEDRCEACIKCQMMEATLQTPTNASELEYMNDIPRQVEPNYSTVTKADIPTISPKSFTRRKCENTVLVNITAAEPVETKETEYCSKAEVGVREVIEFPMCQSGGQKCGVPSGFDASLLGGVTDHYVPDMVLQGTLAAPKKWEAELRRDLDLTSYLNKTMDAPIQAIAIIGDTNTWEVRVVSREGTVSAGMSALVAAMLDALPLMRSARVPATQCLSFLEGKLREFCVLSKTLADMLMSTDFCDIAMLTKSLNIDINDVPLLIAVASTHTPMVARRYGISYR